MSIKTAESTLHTNRTPAPRPAALACLLLVGSLLGLSLIVAKMVIGQGVMPLPFLLLSLIGAGIILLTGERLKGRPFSVNRRIVEYGLVAGALFAVPNIFGFMAVKHVGAGFLSLTLAFPILITYILSLILGLDKFRPIKALGVASGLTGGCILALSKLSSGDSPLIWVILSVSGPLIIAVGNIYRTLRWPSGTSSMFLAALMLLGGAAFLLPVSLVFSPDAFAPIVTDSNTLFLLLAQIGLFSVMYLFYFILQYIAGPVYLSQIGTVAAVVGTTVAVGLLGETSPQNLLLAAGFAAIGMLTFHLASRPAG